MCSIMKVRKEIKIGAILLATLAVFIWGYSFLKGKNILKPTATYYVIYEKVGGLEESAPVIVNGVKIGSVMVPMEGSCLITEIFRLH
jgi:phospholipid/cholesterol/gamma-HCH transport system substrate-binding protein